MIPGLVALLGATAGAAQVQLMARGLSRPTPLGFAVRGLVVGSVLLLAALAGQITAGAIGWLGGFVLTLVVIHREMR